MSFYVTTPIYYVNAAPQSRARLHDIAADVMARTTDSARSRCSPHGTRRHGELWRTRRTRFGIDPPGAADRNAERFNALAPQLEASNDSSSATTDPQHEAKCRSALTGARERFVTWPPRGLYCPAAPDFKARTRSTRAPARSPPRADAERRTTYFFAVRLPGAAWRSSTAEREDWWRRAPYNEACVHRSGLRDVPAHASQVTGSVPVPWDEEHVFYVWFDAAADHYAPVLRARARGLSPVSELTATFWPADPPLIARTS